MIITHQTDVSIETALVKTSTNLDKLRLLYDKIGVVRYFNEQVILTHHLDVLIIRAPVMPVRRLINYDLCVIK